jgi:hypothetical protein
VAVLLKIREDRVTTDINDMIALSRGFCQICNRTNLPKKKCLSRTANNNMGNQNIRRWGR